ncbi:hypothetical protein BEL04_01765 [Mucilaginibacter sp. PPCGB 2223]|uniref:DUF3826 domain-containing protein n=1 Tax=Mucilaginibacter sp. PPCGB 2223 TaxID=1886027 RepID=UPI000826EE1E|nr:DUF3826 domain-containing protein [Mucilaginibacter sp. PPCGB 2223]OCX53068.1 hypothetical protein BEL04_01765 [Mucilaginibacter sp. PPCGB 2223]
MKKACAVLACCFVLTAVCKSTFAQTATPPVDEKAAPAKSKSDPDVKAAQWAASLNLNDAAKEARVAAVITAHLTAVRDWHNSHDYTLVPEGMNPITGKVFNKLERQVIINSTIPKSVHESLMAGLRKDLTEAQVELVLDKYTIGKVAFTMNGYKSIVPNMTKEDEAFILTNLKLAREQAIDYKNVDQISTIFKIYKTKIEAYFTDSGRNWHAMYKAYADAQKAKKGAAPADQ